RQRHRDDAREIARADGLAGCEVALDDLAEDLARALVELGEPRLRRSGGKVLGHRPFSPSCALRIVHQDHTRQALSSRARPPKSNAKSTSRRNPMRPSRRQPDELRVVSLDRGVVKYAEGARIVKVGAAPVPLTAQLEDRLPPWLKGQGRGWVTAEYGMLPRATNERTRREASGGPQSARTRGVT